MDSASFWTIYIMFLGPLFTYVSIVDNSGLSTQQKQKGMAYIRDQELR